jgi:hypothetical protein
MPLFLFQSKPPWRTKGSACFSLAIHTENPMFRDQTMWRRWRIPLHPGSDVLQPSIQSLHAAVNVAQTSIQTNSIPIATAGEAA